MDLQNITLISVGYIEEIFLRNISHAVENEFFMPVNIREGYIDISEFYDPPRRQYNGSRLINEIDTLFASDNSKTIGLFSVDLFIPIMTFIFGQAYLNGRTGIASYYRLSNERYGMSPDNNLVIGRLQKEVIHELGHTFGLVHCHVPTCVMRSSTYVEDIDQKGMNICSYCRNILSETLPVFSNLKT